MTMLWYYWIHVLLLDINLLRQSRDFLMEILRATYQLANIVVKLMPCRVVKILWVYLGILLWYDVITLVGNKAL